MKRSLTNTELPPWSLKYPLILFPTFPSDDTPLFPNCPAQSQIKQSSYSPPAKAISKPTRKQKAQVSRVEPTTRLLPLVYTLSIAVLPACM
jgi:hypothetical protein